MGMGSLVSVGPYFAKKVALFVGNELTGHDSSQSGTEGTLAAQRNLVPLN